MSANQPGHSLKGSGLPWPSSTTSLLIKSSICMAKALIRHLNLGSAMLGRLRIEYLEAEKWISRLLRYGRSSAFQYGDHRPHQNRNSSCVGNRKRSAPAPWARGVEDGSPLGSSHEVARCTTAGRHGTPRMLFAYHGCSRLARLSRQPHQGGHRELIRTIKKTVK